MYTEQELVRVAKRENNQKRPYLVVNRLQGKHVPARPSQVLGLFQALAREAAISFRGERLLAVGFAETATAIGAAVAAELDCCYIQTTREAVEQGEYLYFTEAHSHATEQKLVKNELGGILEGADRVVLIEDEVTTGNTILNIIHALKQEFSTDAAFSVASLLNGMDAGALRAFDGQGIERCYLVKTDHGPYEEQVRDFRGDGIYYPVMEPRRRYERAALGGRVNARKLTRGAEYRSACQTLWEAIWRSFPMEAGKRVLVLGTEEFMYPALYAAARMEEAGCQAVFHATTRSPIAVSAEPDYPLHARYELRSMYDSSRVTYVYDLDSYDAVFVITDAGDGYEAGFDSLAAALERAGNETIILIRWCGDEKLI